MTCLRLLKENERVKRLCQQNKLDIPAQTRFNILVSTDKGASEVILDNSISTQNKFIIMKSIQSTNYLFMYNNFPIFYFILIYPHMKYGKSSKHERRHNRQSRNKKNQVDKKTKKSITNNVIK